MAEETIRQSRPKKIRRVQIGFNVLAQIILILFLAAMVNSIAFKHYQRWDFSRDQKYALSDKTKRFLRTIKSKMRIIVFFSSSTPITADVQNLLTEYQYAAKGKIDVEYIDPERNLSRAKELFDKYKVVSDESLLVIDYEGRSKTVKASEMAEVDQSGMAMGEGPRVTAFKGEQAITSAMLDLVEGRKNTLGYVLGHKEPPLSENSTISVLKTFIENENIKFQELNLFDVDAVPADLKTIMIIGPQYDFSDREMKLVRDFWDKQGRILILLDPGPKTPKLNAFLNDLGVKINDDRLMAFLRTGIQEVALTRDVQAHFLGGSPITKRLADVHALFFGGTSSLTLEPERVRAANIRIEPLIQADKGYFAETDYNTDNQAKFQTDAKKTGASPTIGASVEKGGSADKRVQVNSSRLVVVSNATFVQDNAITQDQQALDFISGSVNWLLSQEQLIGIAPKIPRPLTFSLNEDGLRNLRWIVLVLMPLVFAALGTAVWWKRRV
ncbi:MAG TPA: GldG family protein [Candidatus Sulfotelmatobacter sp.]|jgi:ABC-2 type transport system permease protein|nr:GldG family protein [Candidatus Sulfotelmatobacter sp.]